MFGCGVGAPDLEALADGETLTVDRLDAVAAPAAAAPEPVAVAELYTAPL